MLYKYEVLSSWEFICFQDDCIAFTMDHILKYHLCLAETWKSTCTYSSFLANKKPVCCVSLSTFYNPNITPCPKCSCGCRDADKTTASCLRCVLIIDYTLLTMKAAACGILAAMRSYLSSNYCCKFTCHSSLPLFLSLQYQRSLPLIDIRFFQ